jgi:alpha-L-rhamnosidase
MKTLGRILVIAWFFASSLALAATVGDLRCEYRKDPFGIDASKPRLSWIIESQRRGDVQTAYQVLVASTADLLDKDRGDLWDSGKVVSDQSVCIPYAGRPLAPRALCFWKVWVWDKDGRPSAWSRPAFWAMGLLRAEDWKGRWITASKWFMPPNYRMPGFMTLESDRADAPSWAEVDLGKPTPIDSVKLYPHQPQSFPLRFRIEADDDLDFDRPKLIADCSGEDVHPGQGGPVEFPGKGITARRVRILIAKSPPTGPGAKSFQSVVRQMEVWSGGRNAALMRPTRESGHHWDRGHATFMVDGMPSADDGATCPDDACPTTAAPLLRKAFQLDRPIRRATLCYAAHGMAGVSINGSKVGDAVLDPPFTDYTQRIVYRAYDVTRLLATGENVVGATLGNGFFSTPGCGFGQRHHGHGQPRLLAQIDIEFTDGTRQTIATDNTWKWARSEIAFNDVWQGYIEDRRLARPGWDRPGFADAGWRGVGTAESLGGALCAAMGPTVRVVGRLKPVRVEGKTAIFDVLTSGWPRVAVKGKAGQVVEIHGDCGVAGQTFILAADGPTVLEPRFVYFSGPHKLEVSGLNEPLTADAVCFQEVHADFRFTGGFHCSNEYLNRLHEVVLRTHVNYDLEHPLDPMREKQGWTQDAQTMFDTAAYLTDVAGLYRKWWWDMADNQEPNGLLGSVVPVVARQVDDWNCPWWSGVIVWLPWQHYLYYGDRRILEEAYEPMRRYVDYLDRLARLGAGGRALDYPDPHFPLDAEAARRRLPVWTGAGDWLNPFGGPPGPLMNMTGWYYYATVAGKTAALLGKKDEAARFTAMAADVRKRCNARYLDPQTGCYGGQRDNQSAQVMPLALGVVPAEIRPLTFQRLLDAIHARRDHHGTGFVALPYLLQILTESYQGALANRIVNQQDFPSWKSLMHDGVLAEDWHGGGAQMPSCGGAVGGWLYQSVLGIRPDPRGPGFKRFILAPQPDPATGLTGAQGWYDSVHGRIESNWKIADGKIQMQVVIPANTLATVRVPTARPEQAMEGDRPLEQAEGIKLLRREPDAVFLEAGGGHYRFSAAAPPVVKLANPPPP